MMKKTVPKTALMVYNGLDGLCAMVTERGLF